MRNFLTLVSILLLTGSNGYSQTNNTQGTSPNTQNQYKVKWTTNPFDHRVFIENKGQFDNKSWGQSKVLYAAQLGKVMAYFTQTGVIYENVEYPEVKIAADGKDPDAEGPSKPVTSYLSSDWRGANDDATIESSDELSYYYTYPKGTNSTIKANIYRKITYKNIYPGIDIEYSFRKDKDGLEYSIIVHQDGIISKVDLHYTEAGLKLNKAGDIEIKDEPFEITDHSPIANYGDNTGSVGVSFQVSGNDVRFAINGTYDNSKTLVIDPWLTDPLFTAKDDAFDMDWDYFGNVYAYGGQAAKLQLTKMNSTGAVQWLYNETTLSGSSYGDFCTDKVTGTCYPIEGYPSGQVQKINSNGILVATYGGKPDSLDELWRAEYDPCNRQIVIAGGGTAGECQAGILDTNMTNLTARNILLPTMSSFHDMALLTIDPSGGQAYIAAAKSISVDPLHDNNVFMQCPLPYLIPVTYKAPDSLHFQEISSMTYMGGIANGMNGAVATPNWLYLYNGDTVKRYNKNTGALSNLHSIRLNTPFVYGGLDADACDNLFVGVQDSIYVMDSAYTIHAKIPLPNTVYDLHLGRGNALYACGIGFVTQLINPRIPTLISSAAGTPTSCSACNGTATVNVNCGVSPYIFHWSNGSTNQTDTGLCAGLYSVTVTDGACPPHTDSAVVNISGKPGYGAAVVDTNPNCGLSPGNITVYPSGGTAPYTYNWSNSKTTQQITGLSAGTYICIIQDHDSCRYTVVVTLVNPVTPTLTVVPKLDSICSGNNINITASGLKTYNWLPNTGLSCDTCPNPTASPTTTTTYTVNALDSNGCTASAAVTIKVFQSPVPVITGKDSVCAGYTDTLSVTGGNKYTWSTGATTSTITTLITTTKTISVTAVNGLCSQIATYTVHVISPAAAITSLKDSVCAGDSIQLNASGGTTFVWSNGKTSTSIWVSPTTTTTYTLHATAGTCSDSAIKKLSVFPLTTATISPDDSICPNGTATLIATGTGGNVTYKWSTGATTSSITVSNSVTTTYTATVYGRCDSVVKTATIKVIPLLPPVITGSSKKCKGIKDTLKVSGGTTYKWNSGSTKTTYYTGNINADSSFYVVTYNSLNCPDTTRFNITIQPVTTGTVTYSGGCASAPIVVTAAGIGSGPFNYSWKPGGQTTDTIDVNITTATIYTVTISDGCPITKTIRVVPIAPNLSACCDATISIGSDTLITASGTGIKSYSWQPGVSCINPPICDSVKVTPTVTTTYTVTATDSLGCETDRIVTIIVETPCFNFVVPNVFTPNNPGPNGVNFEFYIKTENITNWSIYIYDRWGKEMFKSTNPNVYWTGDTEGGAKAPDGIYYYILSGTCQSNTYKRDGFLQLIR